MLYFFMNYYEEATDSNKRRKNKNTKTFQELRFN